MGSRSNFAMGLVVAPLVLAGLTVVFASSVSTPNTFSAGTTIIAAEVNANFAAMQAAINDNDARLNAQESLVPSFRAEFGSNTVTGTGTAVFDVEVHDDGDCYDPTTGVFTAPVAGTWHLTFQTMYESGANQLRMNRNGTDPLSMLFFQEVREIGSIALTAKLALGDTVVITRTGSMELFGTDGSNKYTVFSGHLVR